jgi:large subunit ribosomal protein L25
MSKSESMKTSPRLKLGTRHSKQMRMQGLIPCSIDHVGAGGFVHFAINEHDFLATRRRHVHLYDLELSGGVESAVVRELQWDAMGEYVTHIDFKRVRKDVETEAEVELEFAGHPKGGMLNHLVTHITVRCLPLDIPDSIEVGVGHLEAGQSMQAKELTLPKGVKLAGNPAQMICNVVIQKVEVAPAAEAAPAAGATVAAPAAAGASGAAKKEG